MEPTITKAEIGPMPKGMFDQMPKVKASFSDGSERVLFSFFPDEISFSEAELMGLTAKQAFNLFHQKDVFDLQS